MFSSARIGTAAAMVAAGAAIAQPVAPGLYTFSPSVGDQFISANHLSRDGRVVAGISSDGTRQQGYRWTLATGRVDIVQPDLPDFATVVGLTPDGGKTLHRRLQQDDTIRSVVTRDASGIVTDLGRPSLNFGGFFNVKPANNADRVFATWGGTPQNSFIRRPYAWTQAGGWTNITPTEFLGSDWVEVVDTSDDGSTWLGLNNGFVGAPGNFVASNSGVTMLTAPSGFGSPSASAINAAGTIAVGGVTFGPTVRTQPAMWTNGVPTVLPQVAGFDSSVFTDVSDNGGVAVGIAQAFSPTRIDAFVWTSDRGARTLSEFAGDFGVSLPGNISGFGTGQINVSGDGTVISGSWTLGGSTSEGFVIVVPAPASVLVLSGIVAFASRRRR